MSHINRNINSIHNYNLTPSLKKYIEWLSALDQYGRSPFRSGNNSKFSTIQTVFWKK